MDPSSVSPDGHPVHAPTFLVVTCEHAGRDVPAAYRHLFPKADPILDSHRAYDIGALGVALRFAAHFAAPLVHTTVTRLLVEPNRSPGHPQLYSEYTAHLPDHEKLAIAGAYYAPHRDGVTRIIDEAIRAGHRVLHVGVHSFTDVLDGAVRDVDVGLLFDPDRPTELALCQAWKHTLDRARGDLRTKFNEPYRGIDDGLTTTLRATFSNAHYAGLEVELRQGLLASESSQHGFGELLGASLSEAAPTLMPRK
jgi:predicted N-formylglutamate amidohydrolase